MDDQKLYILALEKWGADAQIGMLIKQKGPQYQRLHNRRLRRRACRFGDSHRTDEIGI